MSSHRKAYLGSRKTDAGYSLRESLECQGVTTEEGMRKHLSFVHGTLSANPRADITRYRAPSNNPNSLPSMG